MAFYLGVGIFITVMPIEFDSWEVLESASNKKRRIEGPHQL